MITTTMSDGTTTHHHSKDEIETVCLKEACAQFTQSSDTPFLTKLCLLNTTGWENISPIALEMFTPPQDTPESAQILLP